MTSRRLCREWAVQYLFLRDFNSGDLDRRLTDFWALLRVTPRARPPTEALIRGVLDHLSELDARIQACVDHWDMNRLNGVDRNILRLALYEMLFRPDIPPVVSINEAVDLAKSFSSVESGKFVNGVLDRARQDIPRPGRVAAPLTKE